jgi:pilus assembly protein Flp/PilA
MTTLLAMLQTLKKDEEGATMVEYGLMLALIAVIAMAAVLGVGNATSTLFTNIAGQL